MSRNYWLNTHKAISWQEFHHQGKAQVMGFPNTRKKTVEQIQIGDYLTCYQAGALCWIGVLEVVSKPFYIYDEPLKDVDKIWHDVEFRNRVPVKVLISLTPETGVPMSELRDRLSIFRGPKPHSWTGYLRDNPSKWNEADGEVIVRALQARYQAEVEKNVTQDIATFKIEEGDVSVMAGLEGGKKQIYTNYYERDVALRTEAIRIHGMKCKGCGFDFAVVYGTRGEGYIEVHHLRPVSSSVEKTLVHPKEDMTVLCSNCHRMVHRCLDSILTIEQLQTLIQLAKR